MKNKKEKTLKPQKAPPVKRGVATKAISLAPLKFEEAVGALLSAGSQIPIDAAFVLDKNTYTVKEVAEKAKNFFFEECYKREYPTPSAEFFMGYRVCGYSSGGVLPESWEIKIVGDKCLGPDPLYTADGFGPRWAGECEALDRLILGVGSRAPEALERLGVEAGSARAAAEQLASLLYQPLYLPAMPIQDAIDLATYLVETAAKFSHFSLRPATIGGPIEVATITKHEGFRWINRKHYYSAEYNVGVMNEA